MLLLLLLLRPEQCGAVQFWRGASTPTLQRPLPTVSLALRLQLKQASPDMSASTLLL